MGRQRTCRGRLSCNIPYTPIWDTETSKCFGLNSHGIRSAYRTSVSGWVGRAVATRVYGCAAAVSRRGQTFQIGQTFAAKRYGFGHIPSSSGLRAFVCNRSSAWRNPRMNRVRTLIIPYSLAEAKCQPSATLIGFSFPSSAWRIFTTSVCRLGTVVSGTYRILCHSGIFHFTGTLLHGHHTHCIVLSISMGRADTHFQARESTER